MRKSHRISGTIIALFVALHLINHLYSLLGPQAHIEFMTAVRPLYRNVIAETMLMAAVMVQIVSGLKLFTVQYKRSRKRAAKLQHYSGLYLSFFFLIHVSAVLLGRGYMKLDTNFHFAASGLNISPLNFFFIPYYALAIVAFFAHLSALVLRQTNRIIPIAYRSWLAFALFGLGVVVACSILYGFTGGGLGLEVPDEYKMY